jgi:hypothetical protein
MSHRRRASVEKSNISHSNVVFGKYNSPDLRSVMKNSLVERGFEIADP